MEPFILNVLGSDLVLNARPIDSITKQIVHAIKLHSVKQFDKQG
jgi:hypothetical protein